VNAFTAASGVEQQGLALLLPFLTDRAYQGRIVSTSAGTLARTLQHHFGDVLMNTDASTVWALEIKVERSWTGNLFLETWSNRNLDNKASHAERGSAPGWLVTTRADLLLFYFLDSDDLVVAPTFRLKRWAFGSGEDGGVYGWPERRQRRYDQPNDTWGRVVPVDVLEREVGARRLHVRQMDMFSGRGLAG
jgi:hypothetical protein